MCAAAKAAIRSAHLLHRPQCMAATGAMQKMYIEAASRGRVPSPRAYRTRQTAEGSGCGHRWRAGGPRRSGRKTSASHRQKDFDRSTPRANCVTPCIWHHTAGFTSSRALRPADRRPCRRRGVGHVSPGQAPVSRIEVGQRLLQRDKVRQPWRSYRRQEPPHRPQFLSLPIAARSRRRSPHARPLLNKWPRRIALSNRRSTEARMISEDCRFTFQHHNDPLPDHCRSSNRAWEAASRRGKLCIHAGPSFGRV